MRNFFKTFVVFFMVAVLGMGISVSAMATEHEVARNETEAVSITEMENRVGTQIGGISGQADIRPGASLGTCYVPGRAQNIEVTINGVKGIIILRFNNEDTGDFRSFTAVGNYSFTQHYITPMDAGNWNVSVLRCDNNANNCNFNIKFYK